MLTAILCAIVYVIVLLLLARCLHSAWQAQQALLSVARSTPKTAGSITLSYSKPKHIPRVCSDVDLAARSNVDSASTATTSGASIGELAADSTSIAAAASGASSASTLVVDSGTPNAAAAAAEDLDLAALKREWLDVIRPKFMPDVANDPFLSPPRVEGMLTRFLDAERGAGPKRKSGEAVVRSAADRLEATAQYRRDYDAISFHCKGEARKLFMHASNAGASVYFGDPGLRSTDGTTVMVGRVSLMTDEHAPNRKPNDTMLPAQHLRAAVMVTERAMVTLLHHGDGLAKGAYILDVGNYPAAEMATHGDKRYWHLDGEIEVSGKKGDELPCRGAFLPGHHALRGLAVLKEAMRMLERHYPESMHKIYFYKPGAGFRIIFAIFRLWANASTRDRFVLVRKGEEETHFFAPKPFGAGLRREETPTELGGDGPSLEGDRFLLKACEMYDETALLPSR